MISHRTIPSPLGLLPSLTSSWAHKKGEGMIMNTSQRNAPPSRVFFNGSWWMLLWWFNKNIEARQNGAFHIIFQESYREDVLTFCTGFSLPTDQPGYNSRHMLKRRGSASYRFEPLWVIISIFIWFHSESCANYWARVFEIEIYSTGILNKRQLPVTDNGSATPINWRDIEANESVSGLPFESVKS